MLLVVPLNKALDVGHSQLVLGVGADATRRESIESVPLKLTPEELRTGARDHQLKNLPDAHPAKAARIKALEDAIDHWQGQVEDAKFKDQYGGRPSRGGTHVGWVNQNIAGLQNYLAGFKKG